MLPLFSLASNSFLLSESAFKFFVKSSIYNSSASLFAAANRANSFFSSISFLAEAKANLDASNLETSSLILLSFCSISDISSVLLAIKLATLISKSEILIFAKSKF